MITGIPSRTGWRYAERGFRHIYWDAGTMLANTLALAETGGHRPRLLTAFPDAAVARLVGADATQEFPLAIVTLGSGAPAIGPGGEAVTGAINVAPVEFPLVTLAQHAGDGQLLGEPWPTAPAVEGDLLPTDDVDTVILRRGSARTLDATAANRLADIRAIARRVAPPCRRRHRARTLPLARPRASCATGFLPGRAMGRLLSDRTWGVMPRSSSSGRSIWIASTTAGTARPSSMPASSKAACTWPRTRSAPAHPA
jgi:hypothetical protein